MTALASLAARVAPPAVAIGLLLALWEVLVRARDVPVHLMPPPSLIAEGLATHWGLLGPHIWPTAKVAILGLLVGLGAGLVLASAIVAVAVVEKSVYPLVVGFHVIPVIAIGPLIVIWFGFGVLSKVLIAANLAFFPIMVTAIAGLRATETEKLYLARSMKAGWIAVFVRIRLPRAMPEIFGGIKLAATLSLIGAVVAEFISAGEGLGYQVLAAYGRFDAVRLLSGVVYLSIVGVALFGFVQMIERLALPWHVSQRRESS